MRPTFLAVAALIAALALARGDTARRSESVSELHAIIAGLKEETAALQAQLYAAATSGQGRRLGEPGHHSALTVGGCTLANMHGSNTLTSDCARRLQVETTSVHPDSAVVHIGECTLEANAAWGLELRSNCAFIEPSSPPPTPMSPPFNPPSPTPTPPPSPPPPPPPPSPQPSPPPPADFAGSFMSTSESTTLVSMLTSQMPWVIHNSYRPMVASKWKLCFRKSDATPQASLCHVWHTRCDQGASPVGQGNAVAGTSVNRAHTVSLYKWPSGAVGGGATTGFSGGWGGSGYPNMCGSGFPCGYLFSLTSNVVWGERDIATKTYAAYGVYRNPNSGPAWGGGQDFSTSCGMDQATVYQDEPTGYGYTYQTFDANVMMGRPSGTSTSGWQPFDDVETWVYDQDGQMDYSAPY